MNEYSRTFVYKDDKSNKFWTIDVKGTYVNGGAFVRRMFKSN